MRTEAALESALERHWDSRSTDLPGKLGLHEAVRFLLLPPVILGMQHEGKLMADLVESLGMVGRLSHDGRLAYEVAKGKDRDLIDGVGMMEAGTSRWWANWRLGPLGDLVTHLWRRQLATV